jgi:hypothetical protein
MASLSSSSDDCDEQTFQVSEKTSLETCKSIYETIDNKGEELYKYRKDISL